MSNPYTLKELRETLATNASLPDEMPVQFVAKSGHVKDIEGLVFNPHTQSLTFQEAKRR